MTSVTHEFLGAAGPLVFAERDGFRGKTLINGTDLSP
jgi:hypothetical protein